MAGAVLCGGASSRMGGGVDKAQLVMDGERLVERAARRLSTVADPVFVAPGQRGRIADLPETWPQLDDVGDFPGGAEGPLVGVAAALTASPEPLVAIVAVDLVQLDAELLAWLASLWTPGVAAVVPRDEDGRAQPLHAVWSVAVAGPPVVSTLYKGTRSVQAALSALAVREVGADEWGTRFAPGWSRNVNRPEDL